MPEYRAVLFDMDGVLIDTEPAWKRLWTESVFPDAQDGEPTLADVTGRSYPESLRELEETYGLPDEVAAYEQLLEEHATGLYAVEAEGSPAVHDLFATLRDRGVRVGVVSSSPRDWIEAAVERFDLGPLDVLVSATEVPGPGKPAPDVYEFAAGELGLSPAECVVVEDSENGVRAASSAGATVVRFALSAAAEPMAETDAVTTDPAALRDLLLASVDGE